MRPASSTSAARWRRPAPLRGRCTSPSSSGSGPVSAETGSTDFHASSSKALLDPSLRANFRRAMDGLMAKRAAQFPDPAEWEALRSLAASIRARTLAKLPELLDALEARCTANGIRVHWAETVDDANEIVLGILQIGRASCRERV